MSMPHESNEYLLVARRIDPDDPASITAVEQEMAQHLGEGFDPWGAPVAVSHNGELVFLQQMVRQEDTPKVPDDWG